MVIHRYDSDNTEDSEETSSRLLPYKLVKVSKAAQSNNLTTYIIPKKHTRGYPHTGRFYMDIRIYPFGGIPFSQYRWNPEVLLLVCDALFANRTCGLLLGYIG
jgi:hypothetical protein